MASSKRSRAPRSKSSPARTTKAAPQRETAEAKRSSPASAAPPAPTPAVEASLSQASPLLSAPALGEAPATAAEAPVIPVETAPAAEAPVIPMPAAAAEPAMSEEDPRELVARLAYFRALERGFGRTNPVEDWLWAEQEVSRRTAAAA